jgi:hypothetical protein
VVTRPRPSGFVRNNDAPAGAVEFLVRRASSTNPITAMPYFGSGSVIEWPPTMAAPASAATLPPPSRIEASISIGRSSIGQATRFSADAGAPPMA